MSQPRQPGHLDHHPRALLLPLAVLPQQLLQPSRCAANIPGLSLEAVAHCVLEVEACGENVNRNDLLPKEACFHPCVHSVQGTGSAAPESTFVALPLALVRAVCCCAANRCAKNLATHPL